MKRVPGEPWWKEKLGGRKIPKEKQSQQFSRRDLLSHWDGDGDSPPPLPAPSRAIRREGEYSPKKKVKISSIAC